MIGVDSNILLRYFLKDDPLWSDAAANVINQICVPENPGFVNEVVLAETVWTLQRKGVARSVIDTFVSGLLSADNLVLNQPAAVHKALTYYRSSKAGFNDCLILAINTQANVPSTVTIDRIAQNLPAFKPLPRT
jgi:predicted nucleic-acid-binding protein